MVPSTGFSSSELGYIFSRASMDTMTQVCQLISQLEMSHVEMLPPSMKSCFKWAAESLLFRGKS